jgi:hypothetical protein
MIEHEFFGIEDRPEQVLKHCAPIPGLEFRLDPFPLRIARIAR